jgi:hypothetical protein
LQNTKLSHWTEYSQQFKNDGCDEVFAWHFGDQSNCHKIVMVGIGIQIWRCQKGKVVRVQMHVWLISFLIIRHVLRIHEAHENGRIYIKIYLASKEDFNHKIRGNNRNLTIRCDYLLQDSTRLTHINYRADNCYVFMTISYYNWILTILLESKKKTQKWWLLYWF